MNIPPKYEDVLAQLRVALAREAALREENNLLRHSIASYLETTSKVCELLGIDTDAAKNADGKPSDVLFEHAQSLQQRLTVAEQRADRMDELLLTAKPLIPKGKFGSATYQWHLEVSDALKLSRTG